VLNAVAVDIANAVVSALNAETFSQAFTASRTWVPRETLEDLKTLTVSVVPETVRAERHDRAQFTEDHRIVVAVRKKLDGDDLTDVDPYVLLVQEIADYLRAARPPTYQDAAPVGVEIDPIFAPDQLDTKRQFTSVLTVTYQVFR